MIMSIQEIKYEFPINPLMEYFYKCYPNMRDYVVPEEFEWIDTDIIEGFKVDEDRHFDPFLHQIANEFCDYYNITDKFVTQFLVVEPNKVLPWHEDGKPANCCVNCLLSGNNTPIEFEDGIYTYDKALLNIRKKHRVVNGPTIRVMFRIVFYEEQTTFDNIRDKIYAKDISS